MISERWEKIEEIFYAALNYTGAAREEFVRRSAEGDAELFAAVEKLLISHETESQFLESPVWTDSLLFQPSLRQQIAASLDEDLAFNERAEEKSAIGRRVGVYLLTAELGRGGMGVVYAAERDDGEFKQKVAVKLIKRGMDTDFIVKRFRRERQIAAALNHPNIARLFDGGTTEDGLPYFVMEYIDGTPFLKYAKAEKLGLREKLKIFLAVCQAVAHAHEQQIVHRDIKSGNILVTAGGVPKLLDFGIAKILDADSIHESVLPTETQMRLMTPEYASPEQVRGEEITTASDQYSLGVLLYELLTGNRPYQFPSRAPHEIARIICEEMPSKPSIGAADVLTGDAIDFPFGEDFGKNLDRIVLKTLRKNPIERYVSVADFACDLERFLRRETIRAESFSSEEGKFAFPPAPLVETPKTKAIAANQTLTAEVAPRLEKPVSPRRTGIKQGLFLTILAFGALPFLIVLTATGLIAAQTAVFLILLIFLGGILRIIYALLFASSSLPEIERNSSVDTDATLLYPSSPRVPISASNGQTTENFAAPDEKTIAVLPFKILNKVSGGDAGGEFLGVGLADALITRLSNVRRFVVRPTSSVLRFGGVDTDSFAAARELDVGFVLDGNILRAGNRLRVSVQLLDVEARATVWANRFDENLMDFLSLEDAISIKVAELLVPQMTTGEMKNLAKRGTDDAKAHEAYLKGRFHWNTFTENSFAQAFVAYHEAIAHDPTYALAYAGIADYYIWLGVYGVAAPQDCYLPAKEAARRAIELDDRLADAYAALGFAQLGADYDWIEAEKSVIRAIKLNPHYPVARLWHSYILQTDGRFDEGIRQARRAIELDSSTYTNYHVLAWAYYFARRFDEAVEQTARNVAKFPDVGIAYFTQSWILRFLGRHEESLAASGRALELSGDSLFVLLGHAQALAAAGHQAQTDETMSRAFEQGTRQYLSYYQVALVYVYAGESEKALDALERAFEDREGWLIWLKTEPVLDQLRDEPRFIGLREKVDYHTRRRMPDFAAPSEQPLVAENFVSASSRSAADKAAPTETAALAESEVESTEIAAPIALKGRSKLPAWITFVLGILLVVIIGFAAYRTVFNLKGDSSASLSELSWKDNFAATMRLERLTVSGKNRLAAIAPNGERIAFVQENDETESLLIRQTDSENAVQLVAPASVSFVGLQFSPTGEYIYYTTLTRSYSERTLWRVSTAHANAAPQKILENVSSRVGIAPDGNWLAYFSYDADTKLASLFVAELNADGHLQSLKTVATRLQPDYFLGNPSFSPDGKQIAFPAAVFADQKEIVNLFVINLETRAEEKVSSRDFYNISAVEWRENGEEIVINASEENTDPAQLWLVSRPTGEISPLTNDLNNYFGVSLAKTSDALVTVKETTISNVATIRLNAAAAATPVNALADQFDRQDGVKGVEWTFDNRILYVSSVAGKNSIVAANADGTNSRLIDIGDAQPAYPLLTRDGRYLFFVDEKEQQSKLRRYEMATGALADATAHPVTTPTLTPDDKYIICTAYNRERKITLHRVSVEDGGATELTNIRAVSPSVSPDNKFIAAYFNDEKGDGWRIGIFGIGGGAPVKIIAPPDTVNLQTPLARPLAWSADSRQIYYQNDRGGISNIFRINISGADKIEQITKFPSGLIFDFALAPDSKSFALARGATSSDIVIFKNAR